MSDPVEIGQASPGAGQKVEPPEGGDIVVIAVDGSGQAEDAFMCKLWNFIWVLGPRFCLKFSEPAGDSVILGKVDSIWPLLIGLSWQTRLHSD